MSKLSSCAFNIDTASIELKYTDGNQISIYCPGIEDSLETNIYSRSELDWLIYNVPLEYAEIILNGDLNSFIKYMSKQHSLESY